MASSHASASRVGGWSAALAVLFSVMYDLGQIAEWLGWWGSQGGPESMSTPLGIAVLLTPSLLLAPAFLVAMVCLEELAPAERRVFARVAAAFATVYAVMVAINYFVQLAWVMPRLAARRTAGMEAFLFVPFDSFLYAVDILGYSFMCLSALFAAFVLVEDRATRRWLLATGCLTPFLLFQMQWHWLIWVASGWAVTFPVAMWRVSQAFRRRA